MTSKSTSFPGGYSGRPHAEMHDEIDDPFQERGKLAEPSVCSNCGAVYHHGRWQWIKAPEEALQTRCAACRRIEENVPAGYVSIEGAFARSHRNEIVTLARHLEQCETIENALKRIMSIEELDDSVLISTTDTYLARAIGEALHDAFQGRLELHFNEQEYLLRVRWQC